MSPLKKQTNVYISPEKNQRTKAVPVAPPPGLPEVGRRRGTERHEDLAPSFTTRGMLNKFFPLQSPGYLQRGVYGTAHL